MRGDGHAAWSYGGAKAATLRSRDPGKLVNVYGWQCSCGRNEQGLSSRLAADGAAFAHSLRIHGSNRVPGLAGSRAEAEQFAEEHAETIDTERT